MVIDSHIHIGKTEKTERYWDLGSYARFMETCGVDKAVAMPNVSSVESFMSLNKRFLQECWFGASKEIQDRFSLLVLIDPKDEDLTFFEGLRSVVGLKVHPSISRLAIDHKSFYDYVDLAVDRGWYILVHCGRDPISHIGYLINIAKCRPKARFVAAHMGGNAADLIEDALLRLRESKVENVWLDTSNGKLPWLIEQAVNVVGKHRILFGSDEPYADLRIEKQIIDVCDVGDAVKECIFYKNIKYLCGNRD